MFTVELKRWYTVIDTGNQSTSYAGVVMGLDWTDAMGTAGRICGYPETFELIKIFECNVDGAALPGGDGIEIRPRSAAH